MPPGKPKPRKRRRDYSAEEIDVALAAFAVEGGRRLPTEALLRRAELKVPYGTVRQWAYEVHHDRYAQISAEVAEQVGRRLTDDYHRLARTSTELSEDILRRIREQLQRKDAEFAEAVEHLADARRRLEDINVLIDLDQRELASQISLPDVDSLIEEILSEPGDLELPPVTVARLNGAYRRRREIQTEIENWWRLRGEAEVSFKELAKLLHEAGWSGGVATDKLQLLSGQATDRVEHSFPEIQRALEAKGIRLQIGQGAGPSTRLPVIDTKALPVGDDG